MNCTNSYAIENIFTQQAKISQCKLLMQNVLRMIDSSTTKGRIWSIDNTLNGCPPSTGTEIIRNRLGLCYKGGFNVINDPKPHFRWVSGYHTTLSEYSDLLCLEFSPGGWELWLGQKWNIVISEKLGLFVNVLENVGKNLKVQSEHL